MFRGVRTLSKFLDWDKIYRYSVNGVGLELVSFNPKSPAQTVLVCAPHPDDEVFGCGGTIARHRQHNDNVHVVYFSDGSRGTPSGTRDKSLIKIREAEAKDGLNILGQADSQFWRFSDGQFGVNKTTVGLMKALIEKLKPNIIYIPWYGDDHSDHQESVPLLFEALQGIKQPMKMEICQYEVWTPLVPNRLVVVGEVLDDKIKAIMSHKSQLGSRQYRDGILGLNTYRGAFANLDEPAEAFFALPADQFILFCQDVLKLTKV